MKNATLSVCCLAVIAAAQGPDSVWVRLDLAESGRHIAVTGDDHVYVASLHGDGRTLLYYMIVKRLTLEGELVWSESVPTTSYGVVRDMGFTSTPDGRAVVGAATRQGDPASTRHYLFVRHSTGNLLWEHSWDTSLQLYEAAVAADRLGNVFLTAATSVDSAQADWHTVKVDPSGEVVWERYYDGPSHGTDLPYAVAADGTGGVYVAGASADATKGIPVILRYDSMGELAWVRTVESGTGLTAAFASVCVAENGDAYAVGYDITTTASPGPVLRVSPDGDTVWCRWLDGIPECATLDGEGNLCIAGRMSLGQDIGTWKVSPEGDVLWEQTYDGPFGLADRPYGIASDVYGNILVCGHSVESTVPEYDVMVILAYSPSGTMLWVENYVVNGHMLAYARGVATDTEGSVYVTGNSCPQPFHSTCVTLKYPAAPSGAEERQIVPGCGAGQTFCRGTLRLPGGADAELVDITGRKVMDLPGAFASGASGAGRHHDIRHLSPGVYFVRSAGSDERSAISVRKVVIQQ